MYIKQIHFRDWKAFVDASLEFPKPSRGKNVVLIGAKNGFGKTSLLEGIVLGLFGKDGLPLVGRATFGESESGRLELSYNDFMERAFHAQARNQGRSSASVTIAFEDHEGGRVKIQRRWHFSGNGKHRADQEEVLIWEGPEEELVPIPRLQDREDFIRGFVAQHFLPVSLAQFFLFDGEQVQRLAKRDMAAQVRLGIEGILGVPVLRELADDLRKYARDRRSLVGTVGDEKIDRLGAEIRDLEAQEELKEIELAKIAPQVEPLRNRRDQLLKEITSLQGGTYANLKELFESKETYNRRLEQVRDELKRLLSGEVALALAGPTLRHKLATQLKGELLRERWVLGKKQGDQGLERFIASLEKTEPVLTPALTPTQRSQLEQRLRNAWLNLWFPPPDGCADQILHEHLVEATRPLVMERLSKLDDIAINVVDRLLEQIRDLDGEVGRINSLVAQQGGIESEAERIKQELQDASNRLAELSAREAELKRDLDGIRGQLNPKKQELGKLQQTLSEAQPQLRRSARADRISAMIENIVVEAFPLHIEEVADAMSGAYLDMAHKGVVKRITIEPDCTVKLLASGGRDLREMDASAGESQIFALSLIAAISRVSQRGFPIVMDTPLARLDPDHRKSVLKYFTSAESQVILLSQPAEVGGPYLDLIQGRIGASMRIEHEEISDGIGRSRVVEGYYPEDSSHAT